MMGLTVKLFLVVCLAAPWMVASAPSPQNHNDASSNLINVETPSFFNYNSPLSQPGSLQSRPYFDFLSTLYRRDATKTELFRPYGRNTRDVSAQAAPVAHAAPVAQVARSKRAIVFRPLFVYRQQQVRKQQINAQHKQQ